MKSLFLLVALCTATCTFSQKALRSHKHLISDKEINLGRENTSDILKKDLKHLWLNEKQNIFGFIGKDYQRLRVKFLTAQRNPKVPGQYIISGKTKVSENVCKFQGILIVEKSYFLDSDELGFERSGILVGRYEFFEDPDNSHSGIFEGKFVTWWYKDRSGKIIYDITDSHSASYRNNQFAGNWNHYESDLQQIANWGDSRIPESGKLDVGTSEFGINIKYQKHGWDSFVKAFAGGFSKSATAKAREEESKEWWK